MVSHHNADSSEYRRFYEKLRGTEHAKNQLIESLLARIDELSLELSTEKIDHQRESHFNRDMQRREFQLTEEMRQLRQECERDAFVLVLVDGDGLIFEDHLLQKGEAGGKEAAGQLWSAIRNHMHRQNLPDIPNDYKIVTRIYANLRGLSNICKLTGIIDNPATMEEFARGFTGSKQLFDFVDVGYGKDRADEKVSEQFKLYVNNMHCRHVFFGCSHDNGYARLLEDTPVNLLSKVTLLEGVPFERELAGYVEEHGSARFEGIFRTAKIENYSNRLPPPRAKGMVSPVSPPPSEDYGGGLPPPPQRHSRAGSTSGESSNNVKATTSPMTWAKKANAAAAIVTVSPPSTPTPQASTQEIPRNRKGQRVDAAIKFDMNEVKRVQKIKMCNVHYLRKDCPYGDQCTHLHSYKPTKNEIETLKYVARQTPCRFGMGCDDPKCIYGHRCPLATEGSKTCRWGDGCKFEPEMHGIDLKVVRTTKV